MSEHSSDPLTITVLRELDPTGFVGAAGAAIPLLLGGTALRLLDAESDPA